MKCAIMQPTFLPWVGYFHLINEVEKFVFLDDVQFSKGSWHNRNKILLANKVSWLTLPIKKRSLLTLLNQIEVTDKDVLKNNINLKIKEAYKNHKNYSCIVEIIDFLENLETLSLTEINISIIKYISAKLGNNKVKFINSSDLKVKGKRTEKVINILDKISASKYISTPGAQEYLSEDNYSLKTKIPISFINYFTKEYSQKGITNFVSNLSIIDVIANIGWSKTSDYIKLKV